MSVVGDGAARRRTTGVPAKPEVGLAEWTSKIKAMQRQVDEDEEAETRRLEEEIAASRAARLRRSVGGASRGNSTDLSKNDEVLALKDPENVRGSDAARSPMDRQRNQDNALRKLVGGESGASNPDRAVTTSPKRPSQPVPMSLAAFIGGRATGPRLTKHAPQQDAHDPTQFVQRTHITAPHPIFGRGGVAMPGMTGREEKKAAAIAYTRGQGNGPLTKSVSDLPDRDRKMSTPSNVRSFVEKVESKQAVIPQKTGSSQYTNDQSSRQRTISTPTGAYTPRTPLRSDTREDTDRLKSEPLSARVSTSPSIPTAPPPSLLTPQGRSSPFPSRMSPAPSRSMSTSPNPTPRSPVAAYSSSPRIIEPQTPKLPVVPSPVQSEARPTAKTSQSQSPPVSYLRVSGQKDPTPSISRLQGRGFVQSMVKVSSQLEAGASSGSPQRDRSLEAGRKPAVLDRWQFDAGKSSSASPTSPPIISPKPLATRKSRTFDTSTALASGPASPSPSYSPTPKSVKPDHTGRSLKSVASLPSLSQNGQDRPSGSAKSEKSGSPPLGSSKTMISYIKTTKTGDEPVTDRPTSRPPSRPPSAASRSRRSSPEVDELGMRVRHRAKSVSGTSAASDAGQGKRSVTPAPAPNSGAGGKALSHPTKDRARKPRKARENTKEAVLSVKFKAETEVINDMPVTKSISSMSQAKSGSSPDAQVHRSKDPLHATTAQSPVGHLNPLIPKFDSDENRQPPVVSSRVPFLSQHEFRKSPQPASPIEPSSPSHVKPVPTPSPPTTSSSSSSQEGSKKPAKHVRHSRIPSTGNRATVMDVAWALNEHEKHIRRMSGDMIDSTSPTERRQNQSQTPSEPSVELKEEDKPQPTIGVKAIITNWGSGSDALQPSPKLERRKSSIDKYSAYALPPLAEEKTPVSSPHGTLSRVAEVPISEPKYVEQSHSVVPATEVEAPGKLQDSFKQSELVSSPLSDNSYFRIESITGPLPVVDVDALIKSKDSADITNADVQPISVEVMSIVGTNASVISQSSIFYDTEVLAIVHRFKTKSSGLVGTKVWSWSGKHSKLGEKEERKLQELARRYNTILIPIGQYCEPQDMVFVLGGQLVIRQGTRAHWTSENTAMHLVRVIDGQIYIDELDLSVKNLCSGYSYCFSLLGTFYTWYGCGSVAQERQAALAYAQEMASPSVPIELMEGENDDDEMFWMMLGEREYAQADHWKWKPSAPCAAPRVWSVKLTSPRDAVIEPVLAARLARDGVYIIDCNWEYFVVVGSEARSKRREIMLSLTISTEMSKKTSSFKPFSPPVHVLIFPSQIPVDLRLTFRNMDEFELNQEPVPDHMNILHADAAFQHLQQTQWDWDHLNDLSMLPLGLHPSELKR